MDLYTHVNKHLKEFNSIDSYNNAVTNISKIIKEPIFVYHDRNRKSLLYFKNMDENVCVVVKLKLKQKDNNYVATIYPVSMNKIIKMKEKSYIVGTI